MNSKTNRKIFISYKFTDVPIPKIHEFIDPIYNALQQLTSVYCNLYDVNMYLTTDGKSLLCNQIMRQCLANISSGDIFLLVINDRGSVAENYGQGSMIELGYALGKNCTILAHVAKTAKFNHQGKLLTPLSMCQQINSFDQIGDISSLINMLNLYLAN